jgi:hypothetical protein
MNRSDSPRPRPRSTRTTATFRSSYRIRPGTPQLFKRADVAFHKRLLALVGECDGSAFAECRQAQLEQMTLRHRSVDLGMKLAEIDLSFVAGVMTLGHTSTPSPNPNSTRRRRTYRETVTSDTLAMLSAQTLPNPAGSVMLLAGHVLVRAQPSVDHFCPWPDRRRHPDSGLARRWYRAGQRLTHRAPMPIRQRTH